MPDSKNFKIDKNSQAFVFDTGKSYFKAFELPEYSSPYKISVKSYMMGETLRTGYIFYPAIIFLNEEYNITRMIETGLFRYVEASLSETWGPNRKLEGTVHIDQDNSNEKYMIIITTDELLEITEEDEVPVVIPFIFPGFVGVLPTWKKEKVFVPHSPVGKFVIEVIESDD